MKMLKKVLLLIVSLAVLAGCGKSKPDPNGGTLTWLPADAPAPKPSPDSNSGSHQSKPRSPVNPNAAPASKLNKATGPVENEDRKTSDGKVIPIGEREIVAVVHPADVDKAMECLSSHQVEAKSLKDGANIDIMVLRKDLVAADKLLNADADEKHYSIHANSSSEIRPSR